MRSFREVDAWEFVRRLADRLAAIGYSIEPLNTSHGWLAVKRGRSVGPFLPFTDFIFVHDLDSASIGSGAALDALHEEHRAYAEGQMRVPRALRYRVPNTVTIGASVRQFPDDMRAVATRSRHAINSGEKNSVYLVEIATDRVFAQGFERDPLRYGGTWITMVNPSNRVAASLAGIFADLLGDGSDAPRRKG
jgi:hypothetical protein